MIFGKTGTRTTVGLPGTGLSYTHVEGPRKTHQEVPGEAQPSAVAEPLPKGRARRGWLWLLLLLVVVAAQAYQSVKAEEAPAVPDIHSLPTVRPDRRGTADQPIVISLPEDPQHAANERETAWSAIGLAILTGLLFLANLWLIVEAKRVSTRQADDTQRSLQEQAKSAIAMRDVADATKANSITMQAMFQKQMRAYLAVDIGTAAYQDENHIFEAMPLLTNFGFTPARNVCFRVMADILDGSVSGFAPPGVAALLVNDATMAPRQVRTIRSTISRRVPDEDVAAIMRGSTRRLFGWGKVTYEDVYGDRHETNFCLNYYFFKEGDEMKVGGAYSATHNDAT